MAPVVDGLEKQFEGKVGVKRINANVDYASSQKMGIQAVPTYIFLDSQGRIIERQEGGNPDALKAGFEKAAGS